jgi:hypothetical protein
MFWNEFYALQVIVVVLDRFRDVDITEESFFFGTMREGYAHLQNDPDGMAIQVLRRYGDKIIDDKRIREYGLQYGGPLVVMGILLNDPEDKERGYNP